MNNDSIHETMDNLSQLLGYSTSDRSSASEDENSINPYQRAANILKEVVLEDGFEFSISPEQVQDSLDEFRLNYSPETLAALEGKEILESIFYSEGDNTNALCCWLEMNKDCKSLFGSISGGSA